MNEGNKYLKRTGFGYYARRVPLLLLRGLYEPAAFAQIGHRITGLIIAAYLLVHIVVIGQAAFNEQGFDWIMSVLHQPVYLVLDVLLFGAVVFHGLNGVRLMVHDFSVGLRRQGLLVGLVLLATVAMVTWGLWVVWPELS